MTRRELDAQIGAGTLVRVRPGWYARPDLDPDRRAAAAAGGRVACVTASRLHGLWIPPTADQRRHLVVHSHTAITARGAVVHHSAEERPVVEQSDRLLVDHVEAIAMVSRCQTIAVAWVIVESALAKKLISRDEWNRVLESLPARRRSVLRFASPLSGSGTESEFLRQCRRLGIRCIQQVWIGRDRVDVLLDDGSVVELDSREFHDPVVDARRDARVSIAGHDTMRFYYDQVWFDWPTVEAALLAARARRAARSKAWR